MIEVISYVGLGLGQIDEHCQNLLLEKWTNRLFKSVSTYRVILADLEISLVHSIWYEK